MSANDPKRTLRGNITTRADLEGPMPAPPDYDEGLEFPHVSTGHLPPSESIAALVAEAHARYKLNIEGDNSQVYPTLARVPRDLFGVCVVGTGGGVYTVGDTDYSSRS